MQGIGEAILPPSPCGIAQSTLRMFVQLEVGHTSGSDDRSLVPDFSPVLPISDRAKYGNVAKVAYGHASRCTASRDHVWNSVREVERVGSVGVGSGRVGGMEQ